MLAGRVALVTGSTSGIGLGIARALAASGAHVMLNGLGDLAEIERLQRALAAEHGVRVGYSAANMLNKDEVAGMIAQTKRELGAVDILVNNAGIQHVAPVDQFPDEQWDRVLAVNLTSAFHAIKHAVPLMRERQWGRIVNIASVHGLVGSANKSAYVAAKHGLVGLTKVVALENATSNITCNAVCPGWVRTPLVEQQIEARAAQNKTSIELATQDLLREKQPSLRFATVDQLGALVVFLASDAAASMTGASLPVDGAWTAQ
eukprot:Unigene10711_Nuclearia_a/m.32753 Unigene10711_Nuclearia_a/g.32753  ORF Unigene10711_Nuclearia_a/g.32753 Unigene10711_Nuclearia_a/m.32753 type:complete len:261 (-) Unigene10711_Nuclearia_a:31-813(-)